MSYQLVIAEKPSVAMSYAKVLGATSRKDGYLEGNGYLVSWCVGHLVELAPPNIYDEKFVKWNITDLPILPQKWQYLVSTSTKKQFGILKNLMNRPDVDSIVCATDAGREGELIFRLVYQQAGCKKSFSRLWLSSMEDSAIREGFANLKPSTEYDALYQAALCRERADWMVGINASRLFSCLYGQPLAVGRVMTPVLAMTVVREAAIAAFVPQKFYTVELELTSGCTASSRRISEKDTAENLLAECRKEMISTIQKVTRKEKSENPPLLYDLTTLQRDANRLLGYSAQQTLNYVQSLYEKKLTTYPRTDSCYITDDDEEMLAGLADELEEFLGIAADTADSAVPRTRCTVNRDKVTDHHAILPTRSMLQADLDALPTGERNVLKLIIARTLMAVSKPYRYLETMLTTECAGEEFTAKGKEILDEGWKAVERKVLADILNRKQEFTTLPTMEESECAILNAEMKEGKTTPPKHFTEDTLLHSMEMASTDSMPEGVERQGIGTPATRAATIEKLVQKGFLERKGEKKTKILLPTDKGKALITVMPEEIQSLEMTADWETKLLRIERGEMEPEEFMTEIKDKLCTVIDNILLNEKPADFEAFLQKLEQQGYEIKRGKHTSVKGARQKRFIRFRTLGAGYSEDEIKAVIAGEAEHRPHQKQPPKEKPFHLLVDIQAKLSEGKSESYARWAKRYNLKEMSKTLIFLQENKIGNIEEMQERVNAATARYHELGDSIKAAEQRMAEIAVLRAHIINYAKTRPVYDAYRKAGYSKKFLEEHREQITLHRAAKATFDEAGLKKLPKVKELNTEYSTLLSQKKAAYPAYRKARDEMQELMKAQKNVEIFFAEEKTTKEKAQTR